MVSVTIKLWVKGAGETKETRMNFVWEAGGYLSGKASQEACLTWVLKALQRFAGRGRRMGVHLVLCGSPRGSEAKGRRRWAGSGAQSVCAVSWVRGLAALSSWEAPGPPGPWHQSRTSAPCPSKCCHLAVTLSVHVSLESLESGCRLGVILIFSLTGGNSGPKTAISDSSGSTEFVRPGGGIQPSSCDSRTSLGVIQFAHSHPLALTGLGWKSGETQAGDWPLGVCLKASSQALVGWGHFKREGTWQ